MISPTSWDMDDLVFFWLACTGNKAIVVGVVAIIAILIVKVYTL